MPDAVSIIPILESLDYTLRTKTVQPCHAFEPLCRSQCPDTVYAYSENLYTLNVATTRIAQGYMVEEWPAITSHTMLEEIPYQAAELELECVLRIWDPTGTFGTTSW